VRLKKMRSLKILKNIRHRMIEANIDALVIMNSLNTSYIVGSEVRDSTIIVLHDDAYLITHYINEIPENDALKILKYSPYPPQTPTYSLITSSSIEATLQMLKILSRRIRTIGIDEKYISSQISREIHDHTRNLNISCIDASHIISEIRTIKIDEDLNNLRKCCTSINCVIEECVNKIKSSKLSNIRKCLLENLPETVNSITISCERNANTVRFRVITNCGVLKILIASTIPQTSKAQELWNKITESTLNSLNELSTGEELRLCVVNILDQLWKEEEVFIDLHGIGVELVEDPIITPHSDVLVEKGMTLALELMMKSRDMKLELALTMMVPKDRIELLTPPLSILT